MFRCKKLVIKSPQKVLVDISFDIKESLALVGESGSGKSLTLKSLLFLLPPNLKSEIEYESDFELKRGETVSLVPQNPFTSLSPLTKIKDQFLAEEKVAAEFMEMVGLEKEFLYRFPPELSGGQLQRTIIAMALVLRPKLLLLDEPTTALDPDTKELVLELIEDMRKKMNFLILFVTHDIQSASRLCKDISVIKEGKIVESGETKKVLENPEKEYTKRLIEANFAKREFRK
ncbi:ATP-binding cassette domain-containing protein [Nitrosophilus alvini]|uniref:ATP-binding cassette domain-containing protein n=1 Tax=Nitrosophilus alvini TaxID=2714855 RepID=UPI00190A7B4B|nr:ATP-binding cassette domain-containing protein [Nitrosophilus alvini]